jgi:hypothetical protein
MTAPSQARRHQPGIEEIVRSSRTIQTTKRTSGALITAARPRYTRMQQVRKTCAYMRP